MLPQLSDQQFKLFQALISGLAGIQMNETKNALIAGRLAKRLQYYELKSFEDYYRLVEAPGSPERQVFVDLLTTNETHFFREEAHFSFLRDRVLPGWNPARPLRIWSAACSSGQEAYSIAMVLAASNIKAWEIRASDISGAALDRAVNGVYPLDAAEAIPPEYLKQFCLKGTAENENYFKIRDEIQHRVRFLQINLNEALPDSARFHQIWLRNTMIYFNQATRAAIVNRLLDVLEPGGFFITGHSEQVREATTRLEAVQPAVYRKVQEPYARHKIPVGESKNEQ